MELSVQEINSKIFEIRSQKVMIDSDLAKLYQVETKNLNKAVARNIKRFPSDFMFQLTDEEFKAQRFQNGTFNLNLKNRKYNPYVFTEQGISMLSSVLRSDIAIEVNIQIMRTFVEMRKYALTHNELAKKIEELTKRVDEGDVAHIKVMEILTSLINQQKQLEVENSSKTDGKIGFVK